MNDGARLQKKCWTDVAADTHSLECVVLFSYFLEIHRRGARLPLPGSRKSFGVIWWAEASIIHPQNTVQISVTFVIQCVFISNLPTLSQILSESSQNFTDWSYSLRKKNHTNVVTVPIRSWVTDKQINGTDGQRRKRYRQSRFLKWSGQ